MQNHNRTVNSAFDFSLYMKDNYPMLAMNELGMLLKRHNDVCFQIANSMKNQIANENLMFLDNLVSTMSTTCICCSLRSLPCIVQNRCKNTEPGYSNLYHRNVDMTESEGESSISSKRKRTSVQHQTTSEVSDKAGVSNQFKTTGESSMYNKIHDATPHRTPLPKRHGMPGTVLFETPMNFMPCTTKSPANCIKTWADTIIGGIMMLSDDTDIPIGSVVMGQTCTPTPTRNNVVHKHYATDHWTAGTSVDYPSIALQDKLSTILKNLTQIQQDKRIRQIDMEVLYKLISGMWRHIFEVDFASSVLSGEKAWELKSIQDQFIGTNVDYNLGQCRMVHVPAILQFGWCLYTWDMLKKIIYIFDPLSSSNNDRTMEELHKIVADKPHVALFTCIYKFFDGWHVDCINWENKYPVMTSTKFQKNETGICILHIIRHFNGLNLEEPLIDESIIKEKGFCVHQILQMEGNCSEIPKELKDALT